MIMIEITMTIVIIKWCTYFRFFYNAYFQDKKVDKNDSSKQGVEVKEEKEEKEASNGALAKVVEGKEKAQWSPNLDFPSKWYYGTDWKK